MTYQITHINATPKFLADPKNIAMIKKMCDKANSMTAKEYREMKVKPKGSKYRNRRVGKFDSEKERNRYATLKLMERAGEIRNVVHHKVFSLDVNGVHICNYEADFNFDKRDYFRGEDGLFWKSVTEDVKGYRDTSDSAYRMFLMKKALMLAVHGIEVVEV